MKFNIIIKIYCVDITKLFCYNTSKELCKAYESRPLKFLLKTQNYFSRLER